MYNPIYRPSSAGVSNASGSVILHLFCRDFVLFSSAPVGISEFHEFSFALVEVCRSPLFVPAFCFCLATTPLKTNVFKTVFAGTFP